MKPLYKKLLSYQVRQSDTSTSAASVLAIWSTTRPHFGGTSMHRYDGLAKEYLDTDSTEQVCVYCLRPRNYKG